MNIIKHTWKWAHGLSARSETDAIVIHHAAADSATPEGVHTYHLSKGWAGIGYHLYIRKDGSVHEGRPLWASGAQVEGHNYHTLGVCLEGNYDVPGAIVPQAQMDALHEALRYLKGIYREAAIKFHRDFGGSVCPGRYFPYQEALNYTKPETPAESEDEDMAEPIYKDIKDVPEYWRESVQKLLDADTLNGGTPKEQNATDVNLTQTEAKLCHLFVTYVDEVTGRVKEAL